MKKGYTLPSPLLREYIDRYWFWESDIDETIKLPVIYPGTGIEVMFHYKTPFTGYGNSHILCPRVPNSYTINSSNPVGFISVRFKSWAFNYFSEIPADKLINSNVASADLWPGALDSIEEKIIRATDFIERTEILNTFFESILKKTRNRYRDIDWAINYIYYNHSSININEVINDTTISSRTFQRKFREATGVSAKQFQKIARFEKILKTSLLSRTYPGINRILSAGYYDQAHFNKDFRSLTGYNPTEIISDPNYLANFYNTSISESFKFTE